jgi:hypothetical protein
MVVLGESVEWSENQCSRIQAAMEHLPRLSQSAYGTAMAGSSFF